MKIIFSRKGFDSAAGGVPSPLINGRPVSLPVPTKMPSAVRFCDLGCDIGELVSDLTAGHIKADAKCHLDPDLDARLLPRAPGWRGSLGQVGAAQSHLERQEVGHGDVFLFWGLFRPVIRSYGHWKFAHSKEHRVFGWMQIAEMIRLGPDGQHALRLHPWLADHPHARSGWTANNTIYVATDELTIGRQSLPVSGFGLFGEGLRLTDRLSSSPSVWEVPDWLNPRLGGVGMSYHPLERWSAQGTVRTAARGQEFVANLSRRKDCIPWLRRLFAEIC